MSWQEAYHGDESKKLYLLTPTEICSAGPVTAVFTTRSGGVSLAPFEALNLGLHVGDRTPDVLENRRRIVEAMGLSIDCLVAAEQVHGGKAALVADALRGRGAREMESALPGVDALVCETPGIALILYFADCVPVFIFDPARLAIGLAHAGWRSIASGVIYNTLEAMRRHFGTDPAFCRAAIGPAIGHCCYEVGPDVLESLAASGAELDSKVSPNPKGRWQLDLPGLAQQRLADAGIPAERIDRIFNCTCCLKDKYFSFRRDRRTGRMAAVMVLG